jgi:hypothetical protein
MRRMFDFQCSNRKCKNTFEELIEADEKSLPCPVCGHDSPRQLAAPRIDWRHMGLDPAFPGAWSKWDKAKRKHHATDKGTLNGGKAPNLSMY